MINLKIYSVVVKLLFCIFIILFTSCSDTEYADAKYGGTSEEGKEEPGDVSDENQYVDVQEENGIYIFTIHGIKFKMIKVDAGTSTDEYWIGEFEVTENLWMAVTGTGTSGYYKKTDYPKENVSMVDIENEFLPQINRLFASKLGGKSFYLPSEIQWEYAAQGGNKSMGYEYAGSDRVDDVAWYATNSGQQVHPVGQKQPNELGLYDMSGNAWEWCSNGKLCGGCWYYYDRFCKISYRDSRHPADRFSYIGFRIVLY